MNPEEMTPDVWQDEWLEDLFTPQEVADAVEPQRLSDNALQTCYMVVDCPQQSYSLPKSRATRQLVIPSLLKNRASHPHVSSLGHLDWESDC